MFAGNRGVHRLMDPWPPAHACRSGLGHGIGTDDPREPIGELWSGDYRIVNALRQTRRVRGVLRTRDDSFVRLTLSMQAFEIGMVMGKHRTSVGNRIGENFRIANALARAACLL